jgi:TDG/mug DNA glycosylase family protein
MACEAAMARTDNPVPDVLAPGLDLVFVGINPGHASARAGHHFANPQNGFWRLLHEAGFTPRRLRPSEERELLASGLGITNLVGRESGGVADLEAADFARGRKVLARKIRRFRPRSVVFVGITAYRAFRGARGAVRCGEQEPFEGARVFVVPNPSGRNAHFRPSEMRSLFAGVAKALRSARLTRR